MPSPQTRSTAQVTRSEPSDDALQLLRQLTRDDSSTFRDDQWDVIDAIANRQERVLLVQRTGWGKSAVYFISAKLLRLQGHGLTLIVSPLLGLMRNQVQAGKRMGLRIGALHSGTNDKFKTFVDLVRRDAVDVLLISPERFANEQFRNELLPLIADRMGLLVIDEAHCISDWGHDFRPDYQRLSNVVAALPARIPVLATTATANDRVVADVSQQLGSLVVSRGPLIRENLALQAMPTWSAAERLAWLAKVIPTFEGKGIVYTLTTRDAETVAEWLLQRGHRAHAYHGSITTADQPVSEMARIDLEERFTHGDIDVLVATSALGMGYDNPDVRFVVHYQTPGSIIAYYQQVGRAGRGKEGAVGILMSGPEDNAIHDYFRTSSLPSPDDVTRILDVLAQEETMTVPQMSTSLNMGRGRIDQALGFLAVQEPPPVSRAGRGWQRNPVPFDTSYTAHRDELIGQRISEWEEMSRYRSGDVACRMHTLLTSLDDPDPPARCGICDRCLGHPVIDLEVPEVLLKEAAGFLNRPLITPIKPRQMVPKGSLEAYGIGGKIPAALLAEPGCIMVTWGERPDLRDLIVTGQRQGRFGDEVVRAASAMIREHWQPNPVPTWVTCVPSLRKPGLLPDLAQRVAEVLGIPFVDSVRKVRETEPQRTMENTFHQAQNLDGAFEVPSGIPDGPVLLLDDLIDSGWTLTIVSMLLRQAGSGPVHPFALAATMRGSQ
jgi:ATP-dependent DNA helicase RecQ